MSKPNSIVIAIVGRPNVGKSTLFNRLIKNRRAIETPEAKTTRDRLYGDFLWCGKKYEVIDTAGILFQNMDEVDAQAQKSTAIALEQADIILFLVDFKEGLKDYDLEIAKSLKKSKKAILVINKCDSNFDSEKMIPFKRLGFSKAILISAISGKNTGDLLDLINSTSNELQLDSAPKTDPEQYIELSIIGRPNVGKSTMLNAIMGEEKMIVSSVPGTTRDAQDFLFMHRGQTIKIFDTAGIRRKSKIKMGSPEGFAHLRSFRALRESSVVVYVIDATEGVTSIDQSLLGEAEQNGKSIILAVNKIDLWPEEEREKEMSKFIGILQKELNFMPWLPIIFISAQNTIHLDKMLNQVVDIYKERFKELDSDECKQILDYCKQTNSQIQYVKSLEFAHCNPIVFKIVTQKNKKPHFSHLRFLENRIRDYYAYRGCPIFIDWKKLGGKG